MARYSVQPRDVWMLWMLSKNLSCKCSQKRVNHIKKNLQ